MKFRARTNRTVLSAAICSGILGVLSGEARASDSYTLFEGGQVRPLALSHNGKRLFAVNTPDARLEVFGVADHGELRHLQSIPVGLEPVAVAARNDHEVWVANISRTASASSSSTQAGTAAVSCARCSWR